MLETTAPTLLTEGTENDTKPLVYKSLISKKDASNSYRSWVKKQSFVPKNFNISTILKKIEGVYVPVWLFEVSADSDWHGEVSHTESRSRVEYSYIKERDEHYTEDEEVWEPVSSTHHGDYILPVSALKWINQKEIEALKLKKSELKSYDESYLDGWQVHKADLNATESMDICNKRIKELERQACSRQVERLNGCSTKLTHKTSNFALLPLFVLSYTYKNEPYRNLINGLTGEVYGNIPINRPKKIVTYAVVVIGILIFAIIAAELSGVPGIIFILLAFVVLLEYSRKKNRSN